MSRQKPKGKSRGISQNFLNEVSERLNIISNLSKESGVEIPNELEETFKELSVSSTRRAADNISYESSIISDGPKDLMTDLVENSELSNLNSSMDSPSIKQLKNSNNLLCKAVKEKLQEFRSLNKQSRDQGVLATQELKGYQFELKDMKNSVIDIIDEANLTRDQIMKMKEKIEEEFKEADSVKYEEYDMSTYKPEEKEISNLLMEQIKELHQEIYKIQGRIERSENDLKQKESENQELKEIIDKLNQSFERVGIETEESASTCQNCVSF